MATGGGGGVGGGGDGRGYGGGEGKGGGAILEVGTALLEEELGLFLLNTPVVQKEGGGHLAINKQAQSAFHHLVRRMISRKRRKLFQWICDMIFVEEEE